MGYREILREELTSVAVGSGKLECVSVFLGIGMPALIFRGVKCRNGCEFTRGRVFIPE